MEYYIKSGRDERTWSWWTLAHQRGWGPPHMGSRQEGTNTPSWPGRIERDIFLQSLSMLIAAPGQRWSGWGRWSSTWASPPARPGMPPGNRCGTTVEGKLYIHFQDCCLYINVSSKPDSRWPHQRSSRKISHHRWTRQQYSRGYCNKGKIIYKYTQSGF